MLPVALKALFIASFIFLLQMIINIIQSESSLKEEKRTWDYSREGRSRKNREPENQS